MKSPVSKKYFSAWNLLYFVLGLLVLFFLLRKIDFAGLMRLILNIQPGYLVLGGLIYLCKAGVRSARFTRMNARAHPSYLKMVRLSLATSLASQLLPLKLGELSYVYLLKKDLRSSIPQALSSLMVIRVFDLLAIALLFLGYSFATRLPANLSVYFYSILGFVGVLLFLILGLLLISRTGAGILDYVFRFALIKRIPFLRRLRRGLEGIFTELRQYSGREYLEWTALSVLEWAVNYAVYHVILLGIGLTPSLFDTVVAVTFAALASVLPVNSFGSFGTLEAGWATGLVLLGYPQEIAISSGFATHLLTLFYMLLFGGISWVSYWLIRGKNVESAEVPADLR